MIKMELNGDETCCKCGNYLQKNQNWVIKGIKNEQFICERCYKNFQSDYIKGVLDKNSSVAKGFILQRVVANVLGLELKDDCNCSVGFNYPYDLYDKDGYGTINVKSSKLYNNSIWQFSLKNKYIPNTYIFVGFDVDRKHILKVWFIVSTYFLILKKKSIGISSSNKGLERWSECEVDVKPYNDMLHKMSEKRKETEGKECILINDDLNNV